MEKIKKYLKIISVVLFIIFEEILWNKISLPIYNNIKDLKITHKFKNYITNIEHKWVLLLIFVQPVGIDIILTLLFAQAMASGMIFVAIGIYIMKALISILMVIIFNIGKKQLTEFWIIKYTYGIILNFKRSRTFKGVKTYAKRVEVEFIKFKENYLDGDGEFKGEIVKIYRNLKE